MALNYKKNNASILVLDSGNGGKYTLKKIKKVLPNENFIFVEDDKNCPYGEKNKQKLKKIAKKLIKNLNFIYNIKLIVLACNTLSSTCLESLTKQFPSIKIIPTLPVIKNFKKPTLIICTKATQKYNLQVKKCKKNKNVFVEGFTDLAKKIDENIKNLDILQPFLDKSLKKYANMNISNVVLGCTHFNLIKKQITKSLIKSSEQSYVKLSGQKVNKIFNNNPNINVKVFMQKCKTLNFYDASGIVAKNVKHYLTQNNLLSTQCYPTATIFVKTSEMMWN